MIDAGCRTQLKLSTQLIQSHSVAASVISLLLFCCYLPASVLADDSAAAPAFDMRALASIASNLGNNPQIMSMVTNLINPAAQKPPVGGASGGSAGGVAQSDFGGVTEQDSNSITQDGNQLPVINQIGGSEPLRRGTRTGAETAVAAPAATTATTATTTTTTRADSSTGTTGATTASSNPLSGLMSLLPSVLPNLNLNDLGSLLGGGQNKAAPPVQAAASSASSAAVASAPTAASTSASSSRSALDQALSSGVPPVPPVSQAQVGNAAQSVVNQVLSAYANGQIPMELIQLGLSGKVPPQIIELALSGQVPPQMIQMVITGQVPMSTINAFLASMQGSGESRSSAMPIRSSSGSRSSRVASAEASSSSKPSGLMSTTRGIFEALFNRGSQSKEGGKQSSITVPTLLGPVPIQMPALPNVRRFGQIVGGTITNVASMIPF